MCSSLLCDSLILEIDGRWAGGLTFAMEDGVRIAKETAYEAHSVFAPEVCTGSTD